MFVNKAVQLVLVAVWALEPGEAATAASVKLCGRKLSEIMSRVCHAYNSPSWDDPTVVARRKRHIGIADQCCTFGCTWEQLNEYCAISSNSESPLDELEDHMVSENSGGTEHKREVVVAPAAVRLEGRGQDSSEVGRGRSRGNQKLMTDQILSLEPCPQC